MAKLVEPEALARGLASEDARSDREQSQPVSTTDAAAGRLLSLDRLA